MSQVNILRIALVFLLVLTLGSLSLYGYVGSFSRPVADDFCSAAAARSLGVIKATLFTYQHWSGRYSATFLDSLAGAVGPSSIPAGVIIALVLWFFLLARTLKECQTGWLLAGFISSVILSSTFVVLPDLTQSLYWGQGMRSVVPPLIFLTAHFSLGCRAYRLQRTPSHYVLFAAILALVAGGFSEVGAFLQCGLYLVLLVIVIRRGITWLAPFYGVSLGAAVLALALVALAPGNDVRRAMLPPPPSLLEGMRIVGTSVLLFFARAVFWRLSIAETLHRVLALTSVALLPALTLSALQQKSLLDHIPNDRRSLGWFIVTTLALIVVCFVPAAFTLASDMPPRTRIIPYFFFVCALSLGGTMVWKKLKLLPADYLHKLLALTMIAWFICVVAASVQTFDSLQAFRMFAGNWQKNHEIILLAKQNGQSEVTVPHTENPYGLEAISSQSDFWVNDCMSHYYGIEVLGSAPQ